MKSVAQHWKAARRAAAITEEKRRRIVDRNGDWDDANSHRMMVLRMMNTAAWRLQFLTLRKPLEGKTWFRKMPGTFEPSIRNMREEIAEVRRLRREKDASADREPNWNWFTA